MSAEWEIEFEQAMKVAIDAASTLTGLLAATDAFDMEGPFGMAAYPRLALSYREDAAQNFSGYGKISVALQIGIYGKRSSLAAIRKALVDTFDEKVRAQAGLTPILISMANWECKTFLYLRSHFIRTGTMIANSNNELIQQPTEWNVGLYQK